jgi:6-phosphogluconate dehydrogenase
MVHNGIEYGDMQLICEAYDILVKKWKMGSKECSEMFAQWNKGELSSFLIEITSKVLSYKDKDGSYLVEKILDVAGQKGTGKWTSESALELFEPLSLITEAVFCRYISAKKELRTQVSQIYSKFSSPMIDLQVTKEDLAKALFAAKIMSYAQGFALLSEASKKYNWNLPLSKIALIWRAGCIIRSQFLDILSDTFSKEKEGTHLLLSKYFQDVLKTHIPSWRKVIAEAMGNGIAVPCMASSLAYFDSVKDGRLPANLLQAQRDYFGAHTYERTDTPRGQFFHTEWEKPL